MEGIELIFLEVENSDLQQSKLSSRQGKDKGGPWGGM